MGHPLIPQERIDVFWRSIEDGFTVAQAAKLAGLTYQQGRYVKAKLNAQGKRGNVYGFRYGKTRAQAIALMMTGVTPHMTARVLGIAPTTAYNWWAAHNAPDPDPIPDNAPKPPPPAPTPSTAAAPTERRPMDRREGLWSRPPRVSVPPADRHGDDPWSVDWADD